jgi:plastocyanin
VTIAALAFPAGARASQTATVLIRDMAFQPPSVELKAGDTLVFSNADSFRHTATAKGEFDLDLKPGQSRSVVLKHDGTYEVTCRYHPTMTIRLPVKPAPATAARLHNGY